jgi:hypothetical protein
MARAIRGCVLAVLCVVPAMIAADASAQDCPGWLGWACPQSSNPAAGTSIRREKRLARTKAASGSETRRTTKQASATKQARRPSAAAAAAPGARQTQGPRPARPATTARNSGSGDQSGDRRVVRRGQPQGTDVMNDEQKEALFREFLEWQKEQRINAEAGR